MQFLFLRNIDCQIRFVKKIIRVFFYAEIVHPKMLQYYITYCLHYIISEKNILPKFFFYQNIYSLLQNCEAIM